MDDKERRRQSRLQRLKANPPGAAPQGDITRPHLSKMLECKDLGKGTETAAPPWLPPKHGMRLKNGKTK